MSTGEKKGRSGLLIALLALGVIALGVLLYLRSEEKHALELEKQELTVELSGLKDDLLLQVGENDSLNSFIQYETARLGSLIDSINAINVKNKSQLTNYRYRINGLKKENAALVEKLDSANEAYSLLKLREMLVADSLDMAQDANVELTGQNAILNTTISEGKKLVLASGTALPVRIASSGKERKTTRAKRVDRVNVCVVVAQNRIADMGGVTLYVRLTDPKGKAVDAPEMNSGVVGGEKGSYNGMARLDFQGEAAEICIAADRSDSSPIELEAGMYTATVMTDSYTLGKVTFELK